MICENTYSTLRLRSVFLYFAWSSKTQKGSVVMFRGYFIGMGCIGNAHASIYSWYSFFFHVMLNAFGFMLSVVSRKWVDNFRVENESKRENVCVGRGIPFIDDISKNQSINFEQHLLRRKLKLKDIEIWIERDKTCMTVRGNVKRLRKERGETIERERD